MTENNEERPSEEAPPAEEKESKLREISPEDLKQILEDHKKWVESDEKEGKRADLHYTDLKKAFLRRANLQGAFLQSADLQEARLVEANLQEAFLNRANLKWANLFRANLQEAYLIDVRLQKANMYKADMQNTVLENVEGLSEADLKYANLEGATGLLGNEFAQADLTGTRLPKNIEEFKALETVKETSQNARKIFFAMLLGCVYSWLTIATTTDVRLLTNTASSPLPIIGTAIPIAWFYIAAPLVLMCLYFYFHLYLDNLWEGLASLPARFPDGKRLDQTAYPWLLNSIVRRHFKRLKPRPLIAHMKEWITIFLAWWVVPVTMMAFWLRYIPRHDWFGTSLHIGLITVSVAFAIIFYRLCALTLQGKEKSVFHFQYSLLPVKKRFIKYLRSQEFWRDRIFYYGVSVVVVGVIFSLLSYGAIENVGYVPWVSEDIAGYDVFANFREKDVSEKPDRYWEIPENDLPKYVKGATLNSRNLKNADMVEAFLVKADLRWALLNGADLGRADLNRADLRSANLSWADLREAELWGANLWEADLGGADLGRTNLRVADLRGASLKGAKNLTIEQLSKVYTLYKAELDADLLEQVKKGYPHLLEEPKY
jgi:uncharacterized protein YjbI with pentapeptide repeats